MIYIGTSGYNYEHWKKVFYPKDLPQNKWLEFYTKTFKTVELNVTFYRLPQKSVFINWYRRTPKDFLFVCKGSRFITHIKKLHNIKEATRLFFDSVKLLKEKLGLILWQFSSQFKLLENLRNKIIQAENYRRFKNFLKLLSEYKIRQAFEFRDKSWFCKEIYDLLEKHNFTLVIADSPYYPKIEKITANYLYLRFHGSKALFSSNYTKKELKFWAKKIKKWQKEVCDIYCYFNNDALGFAVKNAKEIIRLIK